MQTVLPVYRRLRSDQAHFPPQSQPSVSASYLRKARLHSLPQRPVLPQTYLRQLSSSYRTHPHIPPYPKIPASSHRCHRLRMSQHPHPHQTPLLPEPHSQPVPLLPLPRRIRILPDTPQPCLLLKLQITISFSCYFLQMIFWYSRRFAGRDLKRYHL